MPHTFFSRGAFSAPSPLPLFLSFALQWTSSLSVSLSGSIFTSLLVLFLASPCLHACAHWLRVFAVFSLLPLLPHFWMSLSWLQGIEAVPQVPIFPSCFLPLCT